MSDRYDIKELLGEGGFGETFVAIDTESGDEVVVKKLHLKRADDWKAIELFEREAEVLETLDHPRIPKYLDYYEEEEGDGMRLCLVQERAPGISLEDKVASGWRCDDPEKMLRELLDILIYLQSLRPPIVHRDIKPSNIVVAEDGSISLVDFGAVANALTDSIGGSTMIGTIGYMAPEQQIGRVEMNTDLYGAGMSIVYAATGDSPETMPRKKLKVDVAATDISSKLVPCLDAMLAPASEDRCADAKSALSILLDPPQPEPTLPPSPAQPSEPPEIERAPIRRNIPLALFLDGVRKRPLKSFDETSDQMEHWLRSDKLKIIAFDLLTIGLMLALFWGGGITMISGGLLFGVALLMSMIGDRASKDHIRWVQSRALGIHTTVTLGKRVVTMRDSTMVISEVPIPYAISWGAWMKGFLFLLVILGAISTQISEPLAWWSQIAPFVLFGGYGLMKLIHVVVLSAADGRRVEIDAYSLKGDLREIPIRDLVLEVAEFVTPMTNGTKTSYRLMARSVDSFIEFPILELGPSLALIDDRVLRAIDQFVKEGDVMLDFETGTDESESEATTSAESEAPAYHRR